MFLHYAAQNANDQSPKYLEVVPVFLFENALLLCWQWSQADTAWKIWQLYTTSVAYPPTTLMCEYTLLSLAHDEHSGNLDTVLSTMIQQHNIAPTATCYEALLKYCASKGEWKRVRIPMKRLNHFYDRA
eukprot:GHVN01054594.1.p1 GENE.GHVN01054594.1~~GHVN01054594.1.p1  ORF type:complete len:144 (+),score=10.51 GHVN01054594.1:46-432(+)